MRIYCVITKSVKCKSAYWLNCFVFVLSGLSSYLIKKCIHKKCSQMNWHVNIDFVWCIRFCKLHVFNLLYKVDVNVNLQIFSKLIQNWNVRKMMLVAYISVCKLYLLLFVMFTCRQVKFRQNGYMILSLFFHVDLNLIYDKVSISLINKYVWYYSYPTIYVNVAIEFCFV